MELKFCHKCERYVGNIELHNCFPKIYMHKDHESYEKRIAEGLESHNFLQMTQTSDSLQNNEYEANLKHVLEKRADMVKSLGDK